MRKRGPGPRPPEDRFWPKVAEAVDASPNGMPGCWVWTASLDGHGYGQFGLAAGHIVRAHRFAYEWVVGKIPAGLHIDHLCRRKTCVNPAHLEPVAPKENLRRGNPSPTVLKALQTHCIHGHPFDEENTYIDVNRGSRRQCRTCIRARQKAKRAA